jgi:signal transduction histidine kinase
MRFDAEVRTRILTSSVVAAVVAVLLFGVPLAFAVGRLFADEERSELERVALRAAARLSADDFVAGHRLRLGGVDSTVLVAVYRPDGRKVVGRGPVVADQAVRTALRTGRVSDGSDEGVLVVAVPVTAAEQVIGATRAASTPGEVRGRVGGTWLAMTGLALLAVLCATVLAAMAARRLARPLQELEKVAEDLGSGDLTSRASPSGVGEIDRTGQALNRTAQRLEDMLARERSFTSRASHQLRTPLTSLRLGLESALENDGDLHLAAREAIASADRLSDTVDDVLALARGVPEQGQLLDVAALLAGVQDRWQAPLAAAGRELVVVELPHPRTSASAPAVRQILEVLLDNALRHGRGRVTVTARDGGGAVALDVADEGVLPPGGSLVPSPVEEATTPPGGHRLGLRMAASLAEGVGGRLVHAHTESTTRMTLLLAGRDFP